MLLNKKQNAETSESSDRDEVIHVIGGVDYASSFPTTLMHVPCNQKDSAAAGAAAVCQIRLITALIV